MKVFIVVLLWMCIIETEASLLQIERGIQEYIANGEKPSYMEGAIKQLLNNNGKGYTNKDNIICKTCNTVGKNLLSYTRNEQSKEQIATLLKTVCNWFSDWGEDYCSYYIDSLIVKSFNSLRYNIQPNSDWHTLKKTPKVDVDFNGSDFDVSEICTDRENLSCRDKDTIMYIARTKLDITSDRICAIYFENHGCVDPNYESWSISISPRASTKQKSNITDVKTVVHISDLHYDPKYQVGSNSACGKAICCQNVSGLPQESEGAGYWGDYNPCDTPWNSIENSIDQIKTHENIDYIYFTGDIVSHWTNDTTNTTVKRVVRKVLKEFQEKFGQTPIYPVLGNHEAQPPDTFAPLSITQANISSQWLFNFIAEQWEIWLPKYAVQTIQKGGYYSVLVRDGFRIIGLNSNVCSLYNIWLIYEDKDPYEQLQWLVDVLSEAEKNNEIVHILSHMSTGYSCLKQWSNEYWRIIERFSDIIAAQFYGHTHLDEIKLFYSDEKVISVAYGAGSLSSYVGLNPNYKIYYVDSNNFKVVDFEQWTYDLDDANKNVPNSPVWRKSYSFKETYDVPLLEPEFMQTFYKKLFYSHDMLEDYYKHQIRTTKSSLEEICDKECFAKVYCSISSVKYEDSVFCKAYREYRN